MKYNEKSLRDWILCNPDRLVANSLTSSMICEMMSCESDGGLLAAECQEGYDHIRPDGKKIETKAARYKKSGSQGRRATIQGLKNKKGNCDFLRIILKDEGRSALVPHDIAFKYITNSGSIEVMSKKFSKVFSKFEEQ